MGYRVGKGADSLRWSRGAGGWRSFVRGGGFGRRLWLREGVRPPFSGRADDDERSDEEEDPIPRIRCPRCGWEPRPSDRWACSCGMVWNTFTTHGVCPRCRHQWQVTKCLACRGWSRHLEWYVAPSGPLL